MLRINGNRLLADLRRLAQFGKFETGVDRTAWSPPDVEARQWLSTRLREAGLSAEIDPLGTVIGRYPDVSQSILVGSHTDSVPKGGWLDGALGVMYGLEIARALKESNSAPAIGIDVVSFADEEGRYMPCFGSRVFCNDVTPEVTALAQSKDGARPATAFGPGVATVKTHLKVDPARHIAFFEGHIEQGPRLEAARRHIGIVSGIVGIRRFKLTARGQADHAGTTPMAMRRDAGAALFGLAARIAAEFPTLGGPETVWNIGSIVLRPGAANVVPSEGDMVVEFRDISDERLDALESALLGWVTEINRGSVTVDAVQTARNVPTMMAPELADVIAAASRARNQEPVILPSGAGHDAMILGRVVPAAMIFVPSIGGRSHDITENTSDADIVLGCDVLADAIDLLMRKTSV